MKKKKETVKKAVKKPVAKKAAPKTDKPKKAAPKKAAKSVQKKAAPKKVAKKPVKKADKPLARNEKIVLDRTGRTVKVYKRIPKGWKEDISYASFVPKGYAMIRDKENKFGYLERQWHNKMPSAEKNAFHSGRPITIIKRTGKKVTYGKVKKAGKTK